MTAPITDPELAAARDLINGWRGRFVFETERPEDADAEYRVVYEPSDGNEDDWHLICDGLDAEPTESLARLLNLPARLLAEIDRLTAEERKWRHAGADGIDAMAEHLGKAQGEIERLTRERDEALASRAASEAARARQGADLRRRGAVRVEDAVTRPKEQPTMTTPITDRDIRRIWRVLERGDIDAEPLWEHVPAILDEVSRLRAELGLVDPAEDRVPPALAVLEVDTRCVCCGRWLRAGDDVAGWYDEDTGEDVVAHVGPCPFTERAILLAHEHPRLENGVSIVARVYGLWALHRTIGWGMRDGGWTVTHVPSGKAIVGAPRPFTRREAWRIVEVLGARCSGPDFETARERDLAPPQLEAVQRLILGVVAERSPAEVLNG